MIESRRILIVDPDPNAAKEIVSHFEGEGFDVVSSDRLTTATKLIENAKFDCVIMDVDLPDMKGYDAVDIIKAIDPRIEVILTAKENTKELESIVRARDIFYYYIKSFDKDELKLAVANVFEKLGKEKKMKDKNQPARILVIDDDPDFLKSMQAVLESASYGFSAADNPRDGLEKVKSDKPDLILMDIMMDSLFDGFSLCNTLKTSKEYREYRKIPIIFVSAVKEKTGSRFGFKGGDYGLAAPDDYLDKPVKPDELLARIGKLLGGDDS